MDIMTQLELYFEKVLLTILHLQVSAKKPWENKDLFLDMMSTLLDENNHSLLKRQLQRISNVGIEHVKVTEKGFIVNLEEFYSTFVANDFNMGSNSQEQKYNESALSKLNITLTDCSKRVKLKRERAEKILLCNKRAIESSIKCECEKSNIEELLITVYLIADHLSVLSSIIYSKMKLGEDVEFDSIQDDIMSLLVETLVNMNSDELLLISTFIGGQKLHCDALFNIIYTKYMEIEGQPVNCSEPVDILALFSMVALWCKMDMLLDSAKLLYERDQYLFMEGFIINPSGDFDSKLLSFAQETVQNDAGEDMLDNLQCMYKKFEGFSSDNLIELIQYLQRDQATRNSKGTEILIFPVEKLKCVIKSNCNIAEHGIDKLLDSITLKESTREGLDYKNKISVRPLVMLKNEKIALTISLLMQAYPLLNKRMMQQSFTQNKRLQKYFRKNYDEIYLEKIIDELQRKNITYWKNLNLDKVEDKQVKAQFTKGITREVDVAFINNNTLYFVEYKNWATTAFSVRNMLNEYKKVEKFVKQHLEAIRIIKENEDTYRRMLGEIFNDVYKICLVMVFQKPNAFEYLNTNEDIKVLSLNDCLCKIRNNEL